ncbi:MutS-related protein [Pollutimonas bauzanensis]|uniref:MutS domain V n=1 Tax=Pollutimonas bauzanensis TaxID=658167 RepID=A0A1M6AU04_9BURK|nr:DNA mismatch repair protein MutS [Pollutimonas bauzanensis]SHI06249.1 MutS domain V [Pollutimonas bauzanensis]SHI39907.1 MutS domain V [Pollutimonas bauzanensis]
MKALLMYKDRDFDLHQTLPMNEQALTQDLELTTLFTAMALEDKFLFDVTRQAILSSVGNDVDTILYRQSVLKDCLKHPELIKRIYAITLRSMELEKKAYYGFFSKYPAAILSRSIEVLQGFVGTLKELRSIAELQADKFESDGFVTFFAMLRTELSDDYFAEIQEHLKTLKFRDGVLISAQLDDGNKGAHYILRELPRSTEWWITRLLKQIFIRKKSAYSFTLADRDENGARALSELRDRGINLVANALAQSTDHILSFFCLLQTELAFYIACSNLHANLTQQQEPICFPVPKDKQERKHAFTELYDVCLALQMGHRIVGNDLNAENKNLVIITGANQGGKSTFLRSLGLSQLMMQCGMFVAAESFSANVCDGLFTHYKREEDATMKSGKLDEELARMSDIVDQAAPHTADSLMLFNESFAATNEREGSQIATQIMNALLERGVTIVFVTHMYELSHAFYERKMPNAVFLRAERQSGGTRTFKLIEGEPLKTGYGEDLYKEIFKDKEALGG